MATFSHVMHEGHREQVGRLELLRTVADSIGSFPTTTLRESIGHAYHVVTQHLLPHAQAEESFLYPAVGRLLCAPEATDTMRRDHVEVIELVEELETLWLRLFYAPVRPSDEQALRRVLYGLYTILRLHLAKEEEIYLPLLEAHLSTEEGDRLVDAMEESIAEAKSRLHMSTRHERMDQVFASTR